MPEKTMLDRVKESMLIGGDAQDAALQGLIDEVCLYMADAGVPQGIIDSPASYGVIVRGVIDLWSYLPGGAELSQYFTQRVIQLASTVEGEGDGEDV